jgi:hypothetical protein
VFGAKPTLRGHGECVEFDPEQTFSAVQEATAARLTCWYFCPQLFSAALLIGTSLVG